jgi:hypothetical protein
MTVNFTFVDIYMIGYGLFVEQCPEMKVLFLVLMRAETCRGVILSCYFTYFITGN